MRGVGDNMLNHFTFNGHSSAEYGLLVTAVNPYNAPSRRVEKIQIPYRNGDLFIDSGTYNNIIVIYEVSLINSTATNTDAIRNWLLESKGYHQLTDTINTDIFRVACFYQDVQFTLTSLYKFGKAVISFDCFPQRYLVANNTMSLSATTNDATLPKLNAATISSTYNGEPVITVTTTGSIYFNGCTIKVLSAPVTINSQTMQCYYGTTNKNNDVEINDFPMLVKGNNEIGSTMALSIVPNYWKL